MRAAVPDTMQAVVATGAGADARLAVVERPVPTPGEGEVLVRVHAAGLNRGDLYQASGEWKPQPGTSDVLGLEVAGTVVGVGPGVTGWRAGDRVCALLSGGGYAGYAVAPEGQCLPLPDGLSMVEGASLPETAFTCWMTLAMQARLAEGETVLVHGGGSGIGTFAMQLARCLGARVLVTAGSEAKRERCRCLGADVAIDYRGDGFVESVLEATGGRGFDVVLDMVAGDMIARNVAVMAPYGRHVTIGVMGGAHEARVPVNRMLAGNLTLSASTLRGRTLEQKRAIRDDLLQMAWPWVCDGRIRPVVDSVFPLAAAADAHARLRGGESFGKIVLDVAGPAAPSA